jgi:histidine triad (HIT) family protein
MDDCIFCKIVAGELPSTRIHEDERTITILDIFPATRGHALVIPRAHAADIRDMPDGDLGHCALVSRYIADRAMRGRLQADGVTIMQSNCPAAWQTVFHYHVHVIPRYQGDPLVLPWRPAPAPADPADLIDISQAYFLD